MPEVATPRRIGVEEISRHASLDDLWIVVDGIVYDVTEFAPQHPGGAAVIAQLAGQDATAAYSEVHSRSLIKSTLPPSKHLGILDESTITPTWLEKQKVSSPKAAAMTKSRPPLDTLINSQDFENAAAATLTPKAWAFVSSAATDCLTRDHNRSAYAGIGLRPLILKNVSKVDMSTSMLGHRMRTPIFCAPTSMGKQFHPEGERELGRACRSLGIPQCVSTSSSYPLPEIMDAVEEQQNAEGYDTPVFFQLYMDKNRDKSRRLLEQVVKRGVKAIFLTVDAPVIGKREADERIRADETVSTPMSGIQAKNDKKGGALGRIMGGFIDPSVTWDDIKWVRQCVPGIPIVLKGVQTSMDAVRAMEAGVEGIVLSNHGGRSLDTAPAPILVLLELQKNCPEVFNHLEVYVDGGITRGTDIFKALCLGAKAVGIGRRFLYALPYGKEGIEHFVDILNDELKTTMQMCGVTSLDQVHPGFVMTGAVDHLVPDLIGHPYARWSPRMGSKL